MGVYRTGKLWAIEHFGVSPDIIVFGKSFSNGLTPLSGLWAREEMINPEVFPPGSTHSTFSAHPLGTAVALETLRMCDELDLERTVPEKGAYFLAGLEDLRRKHPMVGEVDGLGLALRMEICRPEDSFTPDRAAAEWMAGEGLRGDLDAGAGKSAGLVLDLGGYHKNVITFAPSLLITSGEMDLAVRLLDQLLARAAGR
jgi:4-aminobutyrate aminotransferase/(S)-3-amino-2-methylpropionate transaminase